jgi:hypothetical protein
MVDLMNLRKSSMLIMDQMDCNITLEVCLKLVFSFSFSFSSRESLKLGLNLWRSSYQQLWFLWGQLQLW